MTETDSIPVTTPTGPKDDFDERVDRCLAMVLHHDQIQEIAAIVKKVHADRIRERDTCQQNQ